MVGSLHVFGSVDSISHITKPSKYDDHGNESFTKQKF